MRVCYKNIKWYLIGSLFFAVISVWYLILTQSYNGILTVAFLNVGQGDAIFIEAPNGNQMLIDGGANRSVLRLLGEVVPFYDRSIDIILATHPDQDHVGGLSEILKKFKVDFVIETEMKSSASAYMAFEESIKDDTKKVLVKRGDRIVLGGGAYIDILFPDRSTVGWESNTASIVAKLVYGNTSFLLTGDSPKKIEKYIVTLDGKNLQANVLKLGHHGSRTSTDDMFLSVTDPEYAIVSAGEDNRYGHPHKEVVKMLEEFEIESLATYSTGTIIFESDGDEVYLR